MLLQAVALMCVITFASCAAAAPSGLNLVTTADLLGHGEIAIEYQNDGTRLFGD
jgi:hypothetical protein